MKTLITILLAGFFSIGFAQTQYRHATSNLDGKYATWDENNNLQTTYSKYNGKLNGEIKFFRNNNLETIGWAIGNKRHSTWKHYNENGLKTAEVNYVVGKKHGSWKIWDDNGKLRYSYAYDNGRPTGTWLMYDEYGSVIQEKRFK